jgi:hypothetical protein
MRLFIATPAYGTLDPRVALSFATLAAYAERHYASWTWTLEVGNANHALAWNLLFHRFLLSDATKLLGVDIDQTFKADQAATLLSCEEDVVMALICKRLPGNIIVSRPLEGGEQRGPLTELERTGFGMFAVSRDCIQKLTDDAVSKGRVFSGDFGSPEEGQIIAGIVDQGLGDGRWLAADDTFSDRWRALGGRLWLHTGVHVGHVGTHVY